MPEIARLCSKERTTHGFVLARISVFSPLTHPQISLRERRLVVISISCQCLSLSELSGFMPHFGDSCKRNTRCSADTPRWGGHVLSSRESRSRVHMSARAVRSWPVPPRYMADIPQDARHHAPSPAARRAMRPRLLRGPVPRTLAWRLSLGCQALWAGKCTVRLYTPFFRNLPSVATLLRGLRPIGMFCATAVRVCAEFSLKIVSEGKHQTFSNN